MLDFWSAYHPKYPDPSKLADPAKYSFIHFIHPFIGPGPNWPCKSIHLYEGNPDFHHDFPWWKTSIFVFGPGPICAMVKSRNIGDKLIPPFNDGILIYFMGIFSPLRTWVDEFIPYYMEMSWEFRPGHIQLGSTSSPI